MRSRGPQRHVQHGPLFRDIDLLSPEHGINPRAQANHFRQIEEQSQGLCGDAVF
jgi:hypothetical protein